MKKVLIALVACLIFILALPTSGNREVYARFTDPNLEAVIRYAINQPEGPLLISDLQRIIVLEAESMDIKSLDGLENLDNLSRLIIRGNQVNTIEPLRHLINLTVLDLRDNIIEDISPLAKLSNLAFLDLRNNRIMDIDPLEKMKSLVALNIRDNQIQDISALANLTNLMDLNIRNNQISDISPLSQLPSLFRRLYISGNPIRDLRPVRYYYHDILDQDFQLHIPDPEYSAFGGFYPAPFKLELVTLQADAVILYTLDGSEPSPGKKHTLVYSEPISIKSRVGEANTISEIRTTFNRYPGPPTSEVFKSTVVRAQTFVDNKQTSPIITHTYFVGEDIQNRYSLPILSITTNPENLFDDSTGIYIPGNRYNNNLWTGNYFGTGENWERAAHLEFYDQSGTYGFSQNIGMRIHGGITRSWPQKTLRLYARSEYGQSRFKYQIFPNQDDDQFKRLLLRNSGNDIRLTFFRDALTQRLVRDHTPLDVQDYQPSVVFINGEYWGLHNIRERLDDHYLARKYCVERDQVQIIKVAGNHNHSYSRLIWDGSTSMQRLQATITRPEVYAHINTLIDIENYIDYMIMQIYVGNTDWPRNNMRYWRVKTKEYQPDAPYGLDGRWRWMVYDTDYGFGLAQKPTHNTLEWAIERDDLLRLLLKNETFSNLFVQKFIDHIDTTFNPERVLTMIDEFQTVLAPEMDEHINRWPIIESVDDWEENIDTVRAFAINRPEQMLKHLHKRFKLPGR